MEKRALWYGIDILNEDFHIYHFQLFPFGLREYVGHPGYKNSVMTSRFRLHFQESKDPFILGKTLKLHP